KKINQMTRMLTFPLAIIQSIGIIYLVRQEAQSVGGIGDITAHTSPLQWVLMIASITAGSMVLMWLGELISERSIGNGISLLITVGIVGRLPTLISEIWSGTRWSASASSVKDKFVLFHHNYSRHGLIIFGIVTFAVVFITWA